MKSRIITMLALGLMFMSVASFAQTGSNITITPVAEHIFKISVIGSYEVNLVASVGEDGILLVDTGFRSTAEELKQALETISDSPVKYIINTHHHTDHIGGNAVLGTDATIISYCAIRERLQKPRYLMDGYAEEEYLADITFDKASSLFFNGEEIVMLPFPGAHTSNDAIVIFTKSKIAYLGDLAYGNTFPSWSMLQGSSIKYPGIVGEIIKILPRDITVVSGHGENCSYEDMVEYQQVLEETVALVLAELESGKDIDTIVSEKPLEKWESYANLYVPAENWIRSINYFYNNPTPKQNPLDPVYATYQEQGIDAAIEKYEELKLNSEHQYVFLSYYLNLFATYLIENDKKDHGRQILNLTLQEFPKEPGVYIASGKHYYIEGQYDKAEEVIRQVLDLGTDNLRHLENNLNSLGYQFLNSYEKPTTALRIFEFATQLLPEASNLWDSTGEVYFAMGDYANSRRCYRKALELDPSMTTAKDMLEKIELALH